MVNDVLDFLISGATVFDGVLIAGRRVDVGVRGDRIAYVGPELPSSAAHTLIDARDRYLCPGFIDTHASTGLGYRQAHAGDHKIYQGVTTEIIGNCGTSSGPIGALLVPTMEHLAEEIGFTFDWRSLGEWFNSVEAYGLPFNIGTWVGHSTLRAGVCADAEDVGAGEIEQMKVLLDSGMRDGALGLSTGLVYAPGSFADTDEIIELARVAAKYNGIYVSHIRDERQGLEDSVAEAMEIGRAAGVPVLISHLKAAERPNWGKIPGIIDEIERARSNGLDVNFEVYPYTAASTKLRTFIPKDTQAQGISGMLKILGTDQGRDRSVSWLIKRGTDFTAMVLITDNPPGTAGMSIQQIAEHRGAEPAQTTIDIILADPDAWIINHCMSEDDVDAAVMWDGSIICSDSWSYPVNAPKQIGHPHPRTFGAFTRFLERYAILTERIPFGQAIRKITSIPARVAGLVGRGRIEKGFYADLVVLDPARIHEKATYTHPRQFSDGTDFVWVNGALILRHGAIADLNAGRILKTDTTNIHERQPNRS